MKNMTLKCTLGAIVCLGFGSTTMVQAQAPQTCADLNFTPAVYERWPFADEGCLEVVERGGETYARFSAEVIAQGPGGTYVRYTLQDGSLTPSRKANPPEGMEASIDGKETMINDLQVRQKVNIYLPSSLWAQPAPAAATAAAAPPPPPPPPPAPEPEPAPMMPTTAGNAGWLAIMGGMLLLLGGALRFGRQRQ